MILVWILTFGTLLRVLSLPACLIQVWVSTGKAGEKDRFSFSESLPGNARVRDNGLTVLRSREGLHMICDLRTF